MVKSGLLPGIGIDGISAMEEKGGVKKRKSMALKNH
jgi:hypothetical protein